jgi:hypothetical protein
MAREGPIVWANDAYVQSGVLPYVHEKGARVPSLRRLYKKHPYFTSGSAVTLEDVLVRARFLPSGFQHDLARTDASAADAPGDVEATLDVPSQSALLCFLRLL